MPRRNVVHAGTRYTVSDDDPALQDLLPWAVLRTRVIDELTLAMPHAPIALTSTLRGARPRIAGGGFCGLVARPRDVAPALVAPGGFSAEVTAPGYLPRDLTPAIELAKRTLTSPAAAAVLDVLPADPAPPRIQFRPGRGVMIERSGPTNPEQFTTVIQTVPPPIATDVPLDDQVVPPRPAGTRVAGVPIVLPDQPLHREGSVRIRGRVQLRTGPNTIVPAIGASVGILGVWWDYPSSITAVPLAPDVCVIEPALRFAHQVGALVRTCTLNPLGPIRELRAHAPLVSRELMIAPTGGLNPLGGDVIRVGDPATGDDEVVVSAGFESIGDPAVPVRVRLRMPTGIIHRTGDLVQVVQVVGIAPVGVIAREALPGDTVLFASGVTALPTLSTVIVDPLTPRVSFHRARQVPSTPDGNVFSHLVLPDGQGRFEWPPLARLAQIRVVATLPPNAPVQRDVALDYGGEATLAIILT